MTDPFDTSISPTTEPESLIVGMYTAWRRDLDYSDADFTLKYVFRPTASIDDPYELTGTLTDGYWVFEVTAAIAALWLAGNYVWDLIVVRNSDNAEYVLSIGAIEFFLTTTDRRTHAELMVVKIESILFGRADSDVESYSIKSRSITKMSTKELTQWREYYLAEIGRTGGSLTTGAKKNTVIVRFK